MIDNIPQMPQDQDAEAAVLGCCLIDPDRLRELDLAPTEHYLERHAMIHRGMLALLRQGLEPDYVTLCSYLAAHDQLENVGGSGYIAGLINATPTSYNVHAYATIVREKAWRRAHIALAGQIARDAYDTTSDLDAARAQWLAELVRTISSRKGAEPIQVTARALGAELEARIANPAEIYGIRTGFLDFDHITKGLQPGEVVLLAGLPGLGKSLFAGQAAFQMATAGTPGVYYAMEMQAIAVLRRQLAGLTRITTARLQGGDVREGEIEPMYAQLAVLSQLPLYISDSTHWTTATLRADIARLKAQAGIKFVVVDHASLLKDVARDPNERDKIISQGLHDIAKDYQVAVLAIQTMNKEGLRAGDSPTLADVSGSVKWLFDADIVCLLTGHLPQKGGSKLPRMRTVSFRKVREGDNHIYFHLLQAFVHDDRGRERGLPRFESVAED